MTIFTKCHATLLAMWISERNAEKWRANIGAPIGACHETTPCVGRNQEVPVEQIIIFIGSVTHGPSSIVWRHVTIGLKCIGMASSIRVQLVHAIIPGKTSILNVQAMKSNKWTWILKGTIPEFMWVKEVGLSVWLMTTAEFGKFESSRVIEFEQGSYYRKWNLLGVKEPLKFLRTLKVLINSFYGNCFW